MARVPVDVWLTDHFTPSSKFMSLKPILVDVASVTVSDFCAQVLVSHNDECVASHSWDITDLTLYYTSQTGDLKPGKSVSDLPRPYIDFLVDSEHQNTAHPGHNDAVFRKLVEKDIFTFFFVRTKAEATSSTSNTLLSETESAKRRLSSVTPGPSAKRHDSSSPYKLLPIIGHTSESTFFTTVERGDGTPYMYTNVNRVSDFTKMLHYQYSLIPDHSMLIEELCGSVNRAGAILTFCHFDPDSRRLVATMIASFFDLAFSRHFPAHFDGMKISKSAIAHSEHLVLNLTFNRVTAVDVGDFEMKTRNIVYNALRLFCTKYSDQLGHVPWYPDPKDLELNIGLILKTINDRSLATIMILEDYDVPLNQLWKRGLRSNSPSNHEEGANWIRDILLVDAHKSPNVKFILLIGEQPSASLTMKRIDFRSLDLSHEAQFNTAGTLPKDVAGAMLCWIYTTGRPTPPSKMELIALRQLELENAAGWYRHSDCLLNASAVGNAGLRADWAFGMLNMAAVQRDKPAKPLLDSKAGKMIIDIGLSDSDEALLAIAITLAPEEDRDRILALLAPSSTRGGSYRRPKDHLPLGYSHIERMDRPTDSSTKPPEHLAMKKVAGAVPGAVMQLMFHLGLVTYTYPQDTGEAVMVFANETCQKFVDRVVRMRLHSLYASDPYSLPMLRESIQRIYRTFSSRMLDEINEAQFQRDLIFMLLLVGSLFGAVNLVGELKLLFNNVPQWSDLTITEPAPSSESLPTCTDVELKIAKPRAMMNGMYGPEIFRNTTGVATEFHMQDRFCRMLDNAQADLQHLLEKNPDFWTDKNVKKEYHLDQTDAPTFLDWSGTRPLLFKDLRFAFVDDNGKTRYRSLYTHFREGIDQAVKYQALLARGDVKEQVRFEGDSGLSGIDDFRIQATRAEEGKFTMIEAMVWMMVGGRFIVHHTLPARRSESLFSSVAQ